MSDYVKVSVDMLKKILNSYEEPTADTIYELYEISNGNKEVILEHLKAISNIFIKAIEELENNVR